MPWFNDVAVDPLDPEVLCAATPWGVYRLDTRQVGTSIAEASPTLPGRFASNRTIPTLQPADHHRVPAPAGRARAAHPVQRRRSGGAPAGGPGAGSRA